MDIFDHSQGMIKFSPLIDQTASQIAMFKKENDLLEHPLIKEDYQSVGCTHCTFKGVGRTGRWQGNSKTECGLHLDSNGKNEKLNKMKTK